jgi:hypothetical protein
MTTPTDFNATLAKIDDYGIFSEDAGTIRQRLELALQGVAAVEGGHSTDLGIIDWPGKMIRAFEAAIHQEICDSKKGGLNEEYQKVFKDALTKEGVASVAAVVLKIVSVVNPAFAVSTVGIYLAMWLLKVGLNHWCTLPKK